MNNIHTRQFRRFFSILIAALTITLSASFVSADSPGKLIVAKIEEGIKVLKEPSLQGIDKFSLRREKLWETVSPILDFTETSKRALGPHWLKLSPEERETYTNAFVAVLKNIYLSKSDSYQGERIEFVREIISGNRGKVRTIFHTADGKKVIIDFSMHKKNNEWKVYDLQVEGVSIISNYRSQFNSILAKGTFEELMEKLLKKQNEFAEIDG